MLCGVDETKAKAEPRMMVIQWTPVLLLMVDSTVQQGRQKTAQHVETGQEASSARSDHIPTTNPFLINGGGEDNTWVIVEDGLYINLLEALLGLDAVQFNEEE